MRKTLNKYNPILTRFDIKRNHIIFTKFIYRGVRYYAKKWEKKNTSN